MTSNPPRQCCSAGHLHEGTPTGKSIRTQHNVEGYLAVSQTNSKIGIILAPDIIGIWQNSKLVADAFAREGYTCLLIDQFNGDQLSLNMPDGFDIMGWLAAGSDGKNPHTPENVDPVIVDGINYLKELGCTRIGGVGYCFGAKFIVRHLTGLIDCGFIAHPSFVSPDELAAITRPLSIAAAETDDIFPAEKRHQSEDLLKKTKQSYQINLFSGVDHGFAIRSNLGNKDASFAKEQAFWQAVAWFNRHLLAQDQ